MAMWDYEKVGGLFNKRDKISHSIYPPVLKSLQISLVWSPTKDYHFSLRTTYVLGASFKLEGNATRPLMVNEDDAQGCYLPVTLPDFAGSFVPGPAELLPSNPRAPGGPRRTAPPDGRADRGPIDPLG